MLRARNGRVAFMLIVVRAAEGIDEPQALHAAVGPVEPLLLRKLLAEIWVDGTRCKRIAVATVKPAYAASRASAQHTSPHHRLVQELINAEIAPAAHGEQRVASAHLDDISTPESGRDALWRRQRLQVGDIEPFDLQPRVSEAYGALPTVVRRRAHPDNLGLLLTGCRDDLITQPVCVRRWSCATREDLSLRKRRLLRACERTCTCCCCTAGTQLRRQRAQPTRRSHRRGTGVASDRRTPPVRAVAAGRSVSLFEFVDELSKASAQLLEFPLVESHDTDNSYQ